MGHARLLGSFLNRLNAAGHQEVDRGVDPFRYPPLTDARIHVGLVWSRAASARLAGLVGVMSFMGHHRRAAASPQRTKRHVCQTVFARL